MWLGLCQPIAFIARRWCAFKRLPYADISAVRPASNNAAKRSVGAVSMTSPRALLQQGLTQLRDQIINQHPSISAGLFALANKQTGK